jgi:cytochrome c2
MFAASLAAPAAGDPTAGQQVFSARCAACQPAVRQALQRAGWDIHSVERDVLGQSEFAGNHNGDGRECLIDLDAWPAFKL